MTINEMKSFRVDIDDKLERDAAAEIEEVRALHHQHLNDKDPASGYSKITKAYHKRKNRQKPRTGGSIANRNT